MGEQTFGIDPAITSRIAADITDIQGLGVEVGVVIGGGNIFRGVAASARGMDRATGDYMGMLATVINSLAMQDALEQHGTVTRVVTAIEMRAVAEPFIAGACDTRKGRVVIFCRGTGNPIYDRYGCRVARHGNKGRCHPEGHQGRWDLYRRSDDRQGGHALRQDFLSRSHREGPRGDGCDRHHAVHG